jgi:hypothetical protein
MFSNVCAGLAYTEAGERESSCCFRRDVLVAEFDDYYFSSCG